MPEVNQTNTYDSSVPWLFHESYYNVTDHQCYISIVDKRISAGIVSGRYKTNLDCFIFRTDEFGDETVSLIQTFADNFDYDCYVRDDCILVLKDHYLSSIGVNPNKDERFQVGTVFISGSDVSDIVNKYTNTNGFPGANFYWSDSDLGNEDDTENEEDIGTGDGDTTGDTGEEGGSDIESPSGDSPGSDYDIVDIDNLDDATEILQEMYKAQTSYYTDSIEVQRNAFDVSIVALSLDFCIVFLCGILVGCAFARSLWHKMNVG